MMHNEQNAFTLLEVLIALGILSIGLLAIIGMLITTIKGNAGSKNLATATFLAEQKIEELKGAGFGNRSNGSETNIDPNGRRGGIFTRSWAITPGYQGSVNMEQITVTVTWTDPNRDHSVYLATVLSNRM